MAQPAGVGLAGKDGDVGRNILRFLHGCLVLAGVEPQRHTGNGEAEVQVRTTFGKVEGTARALLPEVSQPFDVIPASVGHKVAAVLVLQLHHEDGTTLAAHARGGNACHFLQVALLRRHELRVIQCTQLRPRLRQQVMRQTAEVPLAANVGTGAEEHPHALCGAKVDEGGNVPVTGVVEGTVLQLQVIPEHVEGNGVEPHGSGSANAVLPMLARDALRVHLARANLERFTVEHELAVHLSAEGKLRHLPCHGLLEVLHRLHPRLRCHCCKNCCCHR